MKIRFSKTLAAILAATTITAISGISAMAATVTTTTNYTWGDDNATVQVTSVVKAADKEDAQVTYLVATATPSEANAIKYIDQAPIKNGEATFTFSASQNVIYDGTISAKFGSDNPAIAGDMKTFTFVEGVDYFNNGTTGCTATSIVPVVDGKYTVLYGTLNGQAREYGVKLNGVKYPAMATTADATGGKFAVVIQGWLYDETLPDTDPNYVPVEFYAE